MNTQIHNRRSIRLKGYDYTKSGAYFITICTHNRENLFGEIKNGEMIINEFGRIVNYTWFDLIHHVSHIELGEFVIMPNHIHGIIQTIDDIDFIGVGAGSEPTPTTLSYQKTDSVDEPTPSMNHEIDSVDKPAHANKKRHGLPEIVRQFKTFSARKINVIRNTTGFAVWQRNYYEHIIRGDELDRIQHYILDNPSHWNSDKNFTG